MSQTGNKVEWCLRKAKKEREGGKKHRGLVKTSPDLDRANNHILKAEHNLRAIDYFNKGGFSDWSMSAVFYTIYHCFLAISLKFGYESRNQECTIALIKWLKEDKKIDIDNKFIEALEIYDEQERQETNVIESREHYTYGTTVSINNEEEIKKNINLCKECIAQTKKIIYQSI